MASFVRGSERYTKAPPIPPLREGDRLDQPTFHERYEAMPEHVRAELIGGVVYMASPRKLPHSFSSALVTHWLCGYRVATPGTGILRDPTDILGPHSEPQPDDCLIIMPECGGQVRFNEKQYLTGPPELIVETAWATEKLDLNEKKSDYEQALVREYVVVALRSQKVLWFTRRAGKFVAMKPGKDGIFRSRVFSGLWLDPDALLHGDYTRVLAVLQEGLNSKEHAAFVAKLAARKRKRRAK
jgi:Uma2 family endonuclease